MTTGGIPPGFRGQKEIDTGKTRPREALPRAPTGLKFNHAALTRCPQPMPSTDTFFCFGHVVGANGTAAQEKA